MFTADDAIDIHVGTEYLFHKKRGLPVALRGGFFYKSDNTIRALSTGSESFATPAVFEGPGSELHGSIGVGLNWERFKLDMAGDFSESVNEYVLSFIFLGKKK